MIAGMSTTPLSHVRVVDLTDIRGALAGRMLADLGADVVKVEPPGGDPARLRPPFSGNAAGPDRSLPFLFRNANKRGAVIDLDDRAGRARLAALCDGADFLIENFGLDRRRALGLAPEDVRRRHPALIHVAIADFGLTGPRAGWRAEPLVAFAASGALHPSGFPDKPPCSLPGYAAHDCASIYAVVGGLAALLDRARHGQGQTIEVSVQEAALHGLNPWSVPLEDYARRYPILPKSPTRNADGTYLVLEAADGHVRVLPGTVRHWRAFIALLGNPELLAGPEWEQTAHRLLNGDVLRIIACDALRERKRAELLAEACRLGVPLAPVNPPDDFVTEAQTRARGYFRRTGFPALGDAPFAPIALNLSETPASLRRAAPAAGEDDREGFAPRTGAAATANASREPVLAGVRVVDLGVGAVGPEACWALAELGAEVIKIESRANLDFLRAVTLEPGAVNRAWTFNTECRGQKSVCLDLRTARGREIALELCKRADVIVENNRGGVTEKWGLDYESVRRVAPRVIFVQSQGFGEGGPLGRAQAFGPLNSSFAGVNWLWNHPDAPYPAGAALNHPDHIASKLAALGVLAALEHRRRTGVGQRIEMAQTEAAAFLVGEFYLEGPCTGRPASQRGNAVDWAVPHGVYRCCGEDRWLALAVASDEDWQRFRAHAGWADEPRLATLAGRLAARDEIDARVSEWTRERRAEDAAESLQAAGVSAFIVQSPDDTRADPHLAARRAIVTVEHAEIGPERHIGNPIRPSLTPTVTAAAAPLLGADTEDVLGRWLGIPPAEVAKLAADEVCR
jgi:crotonobetainyl-CoA:carnitine CoA-transferase CaiB-like acyl-CoA transferase